MSLPILAGLQRDALQAGKILYMAVDVERFGVLL